MLIVRRERSVIGMYGEDWEFGQIVTFGIMLVLGVVIIGMHFLSGAAGEHLVRDLAGVALVFGSLLGLYVWTRRRERRRNPP